MISNHLLVCALKIQPLAATVTAIHRASYFVRKKSVKPLGVKSSKLLHGQQQMWTENSISSLLAAGASKTGKVGIAIGSNGDIIVFSRDCLGVKADLSLELGIVLGGNFEIVYNGDKVIGMTLSVGYGYSSTCR